MSPVEKPSQNQPRLLDGSVVRNPMPNELERLALLAEEAAEVIQIVNKIIRHGYNSFHPNDPKTSNRQILERELGDLLFVVGFMTNHGDISSEAVVDATAKKSQSIQKYLHYNKV